MYRGGGGFSKPENALKRAEELENVGQKQAALKALHDVISSKRHRTWQKALETIMFKYVELCVQLKAGRLLKDGLIQYRNSCQIDNVQSLEEVIKHLLKLAHERAEEAKALTEETELDVEDLDVGATPEDLMLSYVSGDKTKDRKDRKEVMPWFRFLWEAHRNALDLLRNNSRLEALYAMTANKAYAFCLTYNRTTEFKRVCEIIRNHLSNLNKYPDQRDKPDLQLPETLSLYMETRFEQLRTAAKLGLWQEAFRTVEDIHSLTMIGKRSPKPQMMAIYYAKLTQVFWVSEKHLYNAYAWYKLFNISKVYNKNLQEKDVRMMASSVVLSTLSTLPYDPKTAHGFYEVQLEREKAGKVANLLGFTVDSKRDAREALSRSALLSELSSKGVLALAIPEVQQIYALLESDFRPLDLCEHLEVLLGKLVEVDSSMSSASPVAEMDFKQYLKQLHHVAVLKMVQQITSVYTTVNMDFVSSRVPFLELKDIERLLVDAERNAFLQIRIDHRRSMMSCGHPTLESDKIKSHLSFLAKRLSKAVQMISSDEDSSSSTKAAGERKAKAVEEMRQQIDTEHKRILARKVIIERRKEEYEQMLQEKEKEEEKKRLLQERMRAEEEKKRLQAESARREEERARRDLEERDMEETRALMEAAARRGGRRAKIDLPKEGEKIDKVQLRQQAIQEQIRERQELARKLQRLAKSMDHFERAKREEQEGMLLSLHEQRMADDLEYQKTRKEELLAKHKEQWGKNVEEKKRISKLLDEKKKFQEQLLQRREEQYRAQEEAMRADIAARRAELKAQRVLARKREYVRRCREAEELRLRIEEEERVKAEQEAHRKAEEERMRILDEQYAKQAAREEESRRRQFEDRGNAYQPRRGGMERDDYRPRPEGDRWERRQAPPATAYGNDRADPREDKWGRGGSAAQRDGRPEGERQPYRPSYEPRGPPRPGYGEAPPPRGGGFGQNYGSDSRGPPRDSRDGRWGSNRPRQDDRPRPERRPDSNRW